MSTIKSDFPIFKNQNLVYLDNAATTQKPAILMHALTDYYENINSNVGRGVYELAELSENAFEASRKKIAQFAGTSAKNITFTSGTTHSLNLAAFIAAQHVKEKNEKQKIILSIVEHHANILPWQRLAREKNLELVFIKDEHELAYPENFPDSFWENVGIIALTHVSNVTGQIHPVEKWAAIARQKNIITVIDGAQGICTLPVDIEKIGCDFYAFSAHKLYGPMGLGILYIHPRFIKTSEPLLLGGGIIEDVTKQDYFLLDTINRFEAGTPNVANVVAFGAVIDYLLRHDWPELLEHMHKMSHSLHTLVKSHPKLHIVGEDSNELKRGHIVTFYIKGIHSHDVGTYLSQKNIAVRVGKHCTHPLHENLAIGSSIRVSLGIYNEPQDMDYLFEVLNECIDFFGA